LAEGGPLTLRDLAEIEVTALRQVGPKTASAMAAVGVENVLDLLTTYPRRWVDRTREARVDELVEGEDSLVVATVERVETRRPRGRGRAMVVVDVADETGRLRVTFFNQAWRAKQLVPGTVVALFGKMERYRGQPQLTNPVVDLVGDRTGRLVPIYPQSEKAGLTTWDLGQAVAEALRRCEARGIADPIPPELLARHQLPDRHTALRDIHRPETGRQRNAARDRLVFEELLRIQLLLVQRKLRFESEARGVEHVIDGPVLDGFLARLPFPLTGAQERAIEEIRRDLAAPVPMHRLLQGDVGAGKTVVALAGLLTAVQGGHQGALMAPTEVLAEQHHSGVGALLPAVAVPDETRLGGDRPLRVELLTGRLAAARRREVLADLASGQVDLVVGTHALLQEDVRFASLGLVVVDEQHRFGGEQRARLRDSSTAAGAARPDLLVMTATPIPRTAAMTVYGDLDVSVLGELPPGRTPIRTRWMRGEDEADVWDQVREEVAAGRQAYVVCPLIEESDAVDVRAAEVVHAELVAGELAGLEVGLLHGRVGARERELTMDLFRGGQIDVLVATTVIEVGVDVPNATVMVIVDADRFGIAQLHQLRGRVGRGEHPSTCFLLGEGQTAGAGERLRALEASTDGFELAEVDLALRGEGTLMGERQTGRNDLKLASLVRDVEWVARARTAAVELVADDLDLTGAPGLADDLAVLFPDDERAEYLFKG
jgi:ATP-dependent DNA helicase RecG